MGGLPQVDRLRQLRTLLRLLDTSSIAFAGGPGNLKPAGIFKPSRDLKAMVRRGIPVAYRALVWQKISLSSIHRSEATISQSHSLLPQSLRLSCFAPSSSISFRSYPTLFLSLPPVLSFSLSIVSIVSIVFSPLFSSSVSLRLGSLFPSLSYLNFFLLLLSLSLSLYPSFPPFHSPLVLFLRFFLLQLHLSFTTSPFLLLARFFFSLFLSPTLLILHFPL